MNNIEGENQTYMLLKRRVLTTICNYFSQQRQN